MLDNDIFLSGSSSDEGPNHQRKKTIKSIRRANKNDDTVVSEPFYVFQTFSLANDFKNKVNLHAIQTGRDWTIKTYVKEHRCLQTRNVKACTYKFLSK